MNLTNLHILNSWDLYFKDCQFDRIPSQGNHVQIISPKHDNNAVNWQTWLRYHIQCVKCANFEIFSNTIIEFKSLKWAKIGFIQFFTLFTKTQQGITLTTLYMLLRNQQFNNKRSSFNHVDEKNVYKVELMDEFMLSIHNI